MSESHEDAAVRAERMHEALSYMAGMTPRPDWVRPDGPVKVVLKAAPATPRKPRTLKDRKKVLRRKLEARKRRSLART